MISLALPFNLSLLLPGLRQAYLRNVLLVSGVATSLLVIPFPWDTPVSFYPGPSLSMPEKWTPEVHDVLDIQPFETHYQVRKTRYLDFSATGDGNLLSALSRMTLGKMAVLDPQDWAMRIERLQLMRDTADFELTRVLRALYLSQRYPQAKLLSAEQYTQSEAAILGFRYWLDEPGHDTMISWTENHLILFHAAEYLAGQLFPDRVFKGNGKTGRWHMDHAKPLLLRWIDLRSRYGFNEWDSNVYYEEDLSALLNLADFAEDPEIQLWANSLIDLMTLDMAPENFYGIYGSSHGRSYSQQNKWPYRHNLANTFKLLWGRGQFTSHAEMAAVFLATSDYRLPTVIEALGMDHTSSYENFEAQGIELAEALYAWHFDPKQINDLAYLWSIGAFAEPETISATLTAADQFHLWDHPFFREAKPYAKLAQHAPLAELAKNKAIEPVRTMLGRANKVTYRTPDYMLSSAQDYRKGEPGNQQVIWQATLKPNVAVYVNNPGALSDQERAPAYFINNNRLPRVAQYKNVLFCLYNLQPKPLLGERGLYLFTHAYFPRTQFDEVKEIGSWTFARKGNAYIGLFANQPKQWTSVGRDADLEAVVDTPQVIWIAHLGRLAEDGSFATFVNNVSSAALSIEASDNLSLRYQAPGIGELAFSWHDPLTLDDKIISLKGYDHFDNPFVQKERGEPHFRVEKDGHYLEVDFEHRLRRFD